MASIGAGLHCALATGGRLLRSLCRLTALVLAPALLAGLVLFAAPARAGSFIDIPANSPYAAAIADLSNRGIIGGFPDGTFRPDSPIMRQQFAKMVVKTLGLVITGNEVCPFADVAQGLDPTDPFYPDKYVAVCAVNGITQGIAADTFAPYDNIQRFQLVSMIVRALDNVRAGTLSDPPAGYASTWDPALSADHGQNARKAEYNGLLQGLPLATLDPWGSMPRGEVAQVLEDFLLMPHYEHAGGTISWTPEAISDEAGSLEVFASQPNGELFMHLYSQGRWLGYQNLGASITGLPAAVSWEPNRFDVVARGSNGHLLYWPRTVSGGWQPMQDLGGGLTADPELIYRRPGELDAFVRGIEGGLWHRYYSDATGWSPWEDLGMPASGPLMSAPTAVWWGDGLDVYVCGSDGQLWHRGWASYWHDWDSLGGTIQGRPAAVSWGYGRVDLFAWDTQNVLAHWYWDGTWHPFEYHGGCYSSPSAVSWGSGHLDVYARYYDGSLEHVYYHNGTWSDTVYLKGMFQGAPSAVAWGEGRIDVFGWGSPGNDLVHWWYDGRW